MRTFKNILILFVAIIAITSCSSKKKIAKKAEIAFNNGEYFTALEKYEKLYDNEQVRYNKAGYAFYVAECYRYLNDDRKAVTFYTRALKFKNREKSAYYWLGYSLLKIGKYEKAKDAFEKYKKGRPKDMRWKNGMESCSLAVAWAENPTRYEVENLRSANSKEFEFAPAYASEDFSSVYFTTSRIAEGIKPKINPVSGMNYTDIYEIRLERNGKWTDAFKLEDTIINGQFDEGTPAFSTEKTDLYYTQCLQEPGKNLGCQIMKTSLRGGEWSAMSKVDIVGDSISVGHPSISDDGLTLYFASRMLPGGYGGADIWKVERGSESESWGRPINLGPAINTEGEELYPFIRKDGTLFFSSNYHPGMGGFDIFRAMKNNLGDWEISNMRAPVNSISDDFGIVFQGEKEVGLFTSNRKRGRGKDDIYTFELPELIIAVEGKVIDKSINKALADADITLIGSDGSIQTTTSKFDGAYSFKLQQYTDYIIIGSFDGFLKTKLKFTTNNISNNKTFEENIELITMSKPVEVPNIFYESGKWTLNESSKQALEKLGQMLEDNPNIRMELGAHTDMVGDSIANYNLSQKRAQSVVDYLRERGYDPDRLEARGYGEYRPVTVTKEIAKMDSMFVVGQPLSPNFIITLPKETQDKANQINRRTELRILSSDYIPKPEYFLRQKEKKSQR